MTLVTNFERAPDGTYMSIEQEFDGSDIPEGSTFVGFDAVAFARSTGQVALLYDVGYDAIEDGSLLYVDNTDERWEVWSTIDDNNSIRLQYYGLGPKMISTLVEQGLENPELTADCLKVVQHIDVVRGIDYVGEGSLDFMAKKRFSSDSLPAPYTDVGNAEGVLLSAIRANIDPGDYPL